MVPVILTSAAWYIIPKGIEYATTDCGANPQSKIDRIRTRLFGYKGILENLAYSNSLTKSIYKLVQTHYPYMGLAVLITPGVKALPFITAANGFVQMAVCYTLHFSLKDFVKSNRGIEWMASLRGLTILNIGGLGFVENALLERYAISSNIAIKQMAIVLKLRLKPSDAYEFLRGKSRKDLLGIIERVKCYKSTEEVHSLVDLMENKFSEAEEDWLESLPSQIREKLVKTSGFNRSILDRLTYKSSLAGAGALCRELQNSVYARAIVELKINPQQYDPQKIEAAIMNASPIPSAFHEDLTLQRYICSITYKPIRYPLEDPATCYHRQDNERPKLYEKSAIENHLKNCSTSPLTQESLTIDQLIPRQDIQDVIEMRLQHYSSNIWDYLETNPFS